MLKGCLYFQRRVVIKTIDGRSYFDILSLITVLTIKKKKEEIVFWLRNLSVQSFGGTLKLGKTLLNTCMYTQT